MRTELRPLWARLHSDCDAALVLADQLNTPWQTFIHLQVASESRALTRTERAEHDRLLRDHRMDWIGPLAPWIVPQHTVFRRGFVSRTHTMTGVGSAAGEHPAWRSVQQLFSVAGPLYLEPALDHLETAGTAFVDGSPLVNGAGLISIQLAALDRPVPWRVLQVEALPSDGGALAHALQGLDAPRLEEIMVVAASWPSARFLAHRKLRRLTVLAEPAFLPSWVALASERRIRRVQLHARVAGGVRSWRLRREGGGWQISGDLSPGEGCGPCLDAIADTLGGLSRRPDSGPPTHR